TGDDRAWRHGVSQQQAGGALGRGRAGDMTGRSGRINANITFPREGPLPRVASLCQRPMASAGHVKAVEFRCSATEQVGFLRVACALGEKLAGVPEHRIAVGALVDGKVALEHASRRPERVDAGLDVGPPRACQRLRRWRLGLLVEAEAAHPHAEAAEFDVNIRASGERLDRCGPAGKYLLVLAGIGADSNRASDVIEDDLRFRKSAREIAQLVDLGMVEPGVEGEAETAENGEPFAEVFVAQ